MSASRNALQAFYSHPYTLQAMESATRRHGLPCRVTDDPISGVTMVADDPAIGEPIAVEMDEQERALLLVALGKAFAKLVRECE